MNTKRILIVAVWILVIIRIIENIQNTIRYRVVREHIQENWREAIESRVRKDGEPSKDGTRIGGSI